jgi:hypothetical protein
MRRVLPLLAVASAGCAHYAKLQNPSPVEDMRSSVRLESLAHAKLKDRTASTIDVRLRVEVPEGATVSLGDTVAVLLDDRNPTLVVGYGVHSEDGAAGGRAQIFSSVTTARLTIPIRAHGGATLRSGVPYRLRLHWRQRPAAGGVFQAAQSREYRFRIQRVSFVPMIVMGVVPLGILGALVSK